MQIKIDLNKKLGKIKKMNATGQAPMGGGLGYGAYKNFHLLSDVSVPYVRLHDVGGGFAANRFVDISMSGQALGLFALFCFSNLENSLIINRLQGVFLSRRQFLLQPLPFPWHPRIPSLF